MRMKELWTKFGGKLGKGRWFFWLGMIGALLLLLVPLLHTDDGEPSLPPETEAYREKLILEVEALCESVKGAGEARVLLTLEAGECALYERDESHDSSLVASVGSEALLIGYEMPRVRGVAVVCEGGGSETVRHALVTLLSAALDISATQIAIAASD